MDHTVPHRARPHTQSQGRPSDERKASGHHASRYGHDIPGENAISIGAFVDHFAHRLAIDPDIAPHLAVLVAHHVEFADTVFV